MIKTNKLKETSGWFTRASNGTKIRFDRRCLAFLERYINAYLWVNDSFVLLSHFMKKTQKTPKREIEKAKRLYADLKERSVEK